jgi:FkbM family methyltransferase
MISTPNELNQYRADTFSSKEPETLEWIDAIPENSIFWDIGANVGLYTCYAAKSRGCKVYAFEPSVFNLEILARNIHLNGLVEKVTIVPLPLTDSLKISQLNMTSTDWGGALSTFGENYGHDGNNLNKVFEFKTIGLSMVDVVNFLGVQYPDFIKMDVDGIEHLILRGGGEALLKAKEVLIEINDMFSDQLIQSDALLKKAGFTLRAKLHVDYFDRVEGAAKTTYNQIWAKS